jgi:hypothetical protein
LKLPHLRTRVAPETAAPVSAGPPASALQVRIYSRTSLPEQEFSDQTEMIQRVASFDGDTRSWYAWLPLDRPERAAEVLITLFEAARVYGTTVQVLVQSADEARLGIRTES